MTEEEKVYWKEVEELEEKGCMAAPIEVQVKMGLRKDPGEKPIPAIRFLDD